MATNQRYRVSLSEAETLSLLTSCYKAELMKRGHETEIDTITSDYIERVSQWLIGNYKPGLLLYGGIGNGKTTIANAVCNLISAVHYSPMESERKGVARTTAIELVEARMSKEALYNRLRTAEMLFIDDIGIEPSTVKLYGTEITPLTDVLMYRYDTRLFTIITSNLNNERIQATYGERIADRFNEMFDKIGYTNASYRK